MKIASITETKNRLSALLDKVRHGETILIMDRDRPVARLEPVGADERVDPQGRLAQLERAGVIRRGSGKAARLILDKRPPRIAGGASVLRALLAERAEGR
jgi:prevent-host-death family protein